MSISIVRTHHLNEPRHAGRPAVIGQLLSRLGSEREQWALRRLAEARRGDAAKVRSLASQMRASDPGMAADLDAAVDRSELASGNGL